MKLEPTDRNGIIVIAIMALLMCSAFLTAQSIRKSHEERVWIEPIGRLGYINSHDTIPDSARFEFDPIIDHSQIPSPKVKKNGGISWGIVNMDTVWDYHRDSIFNVEWYAEGDDDLSGEMRVMRAGEFKLSNSDPGYCIITLVHMFEAPHIPMYYKHIRKSEWKAILSLYYKHEYMGTQIKQLPRFLFYKQYSSYTIHTL